MRKRTENQATRDVLLPEEKVDSEEEDYTEEFEKETKQMRVQFAGLVNDICDSFEKRNVKPDRAVLFLQIAHPLLKPRINEMTKASSMDQMLTIVTDQACSWFDYEIIKDLIYKLGDDHDRKLLGEYEAIFKKFVERRKLPKGKKHIEVGGGARKGGKQLVIKIDKEWDEVNFNDLDKIRGNLASILNVKRRDLYLADIREGCVMLTFMITEELAETLFPKRNDLISSKLSSYFSSSELKLLQDEGIILFTCGKVSWRPAMDRSSPEPKEKSLSLIQFKRLDSFPTRHQLLKAKRDQVPCAAKILHQTIIDPSDSGASKDMQQFEQECTFLQSIQHLYFVHFLGMAVDLESRLPLLLLELIDENLTKMLHRSLDPLAYHVQVDICHDTALAVAYLHSNDIIHRDLSSNNVLMIAGRRAKVTDFGMSKLVDSAPSMIPLTICPGTPAYMPPEALREPPRYTKKLDCFSEGVSLVEACQLWPDPGPRTQIVQDFRSPSGTIKVSLHEPERRKSHIELIDPTHPLVPIAVKYLSYQENDRPSSEELCQRLADIYGFNESSKYVMLSCSLLYSSKISGVWNQVPTMRSTCATANTYLISICGDMQNRRHRPSIFVQFLSKLVGTNQ